MFPFNFPGTTPLGSIARQIVPRRGSGPRWPFSRVRSSPHEPNTMAPPLPQQGTHGGIFTQGLARQGGVGMPFAANPVQPFVPPVVLTAQQANALGANLDIVGNPNARGGAAASQERCRRRAVRIMADVLNLTSNQVDNHIPAGTTPLRTIITAILTAAGLPLPDDRELARLILAFIDRINNRTNAQALPPNHQGGPGPNNGSGGASSGAAAGTSNTQAGAAAGVQTATAPQFKPPQQQQAPQAQPP
ncbi:MAG: hypothetical protein ACRC9R_02175, partial [Enterovibrio sp.]